MAISEASRHPRPARGGAPLALIQWACVVFCLGPAAVHAQAPELSLTWNAPPGCPVEAQVRARVEERIDRALLDDAGRGLSAHAEVERRAGELVVKLRTGDGIGQDRRELRAQRCEDLVDAVALVLALAIDPDAAAVDQAPPESATPPPPAPALHGFAHLGGVFDSGSLPGATAGLTAGVGLTRAWLLAELDALWLPPRRADEGGFDAAIQLAAARAQVCAGPAGDKLALRACGGGEAGRLIGRGGSSLAPAVRGTSPWAALHAGLLGTVRLGARWRLSLSAGVAGVLTRSRFVAQTASGSAGRVLHRPDALTARVSLRGGVQF